MSALPLGAGVVVFWVVFLRWRGQRRLRVARARLLAMRERRP